jgi:hypothetical protein
MNCNDFDQYIDAYLDGELKDPELRAWENHLNDCENCRAVFEEYKEMCHQLQTLDNIECPHEVIENVYSRIDAQDMAKLGSWLNAILVIIARNRLRSSITGAALIFILSLFIIIPDPQHPEKDMQVYSQQEIQQAYSDVKVALVQLNRITARTQQMITNDILVDGVAKPLHTSMDQALKPIFNGDKL